MSNILTMFFFLVENSSFMAIITLIYWLGMKNNIRHQFRESTATLEPRMENFIKGSFLLLYAASFVICQIKMG